MLLKLIRQLFGYNAGVSSRMYGFNKRSNYEIRINSKNLVKMLTSEFGLTAGAKSLSVVVPKQIRNTKDNKIKGAFLRGVIDGDGSILKGVIKIASGSVRLLEGIKKLLGDLGIHSGKVIKDNKKTSTVSIRICGNENIIKLYKILYPENTCFYYARKRDIWKNNTFIYV